MKKGFKEYLGEQGMVICPICDGNKYAPEGSRDQCKLCKGTGKVTHKQNDIIKALKKKIGRKMHGMYPGRYKDPDAT